MAPASVDDADPGTTEACFFIAHPARRDRDVGEEIQRHRASGRSRAERTAHAGRKVQDTIDSKDRAKAKDGKSRDKPAMQAGQRAYPKPPLPKQRNDLDR